MYIIIIIIVLSKLNEIKRQIEIYDKKINDQDKKLNAFDEKNKKLINELNNFKQEFYNFKEKYELLAKIVMENKEQIRTLFGKLDDLIKNYKEGDENLQRKIDALKKYIDDKILELTTKLDLILGNVGGSTGENNIDFSGLDDFMQKLINLENAFEEFVNKVNIDEIYRQLKHLNNSKADKSDLEKVQEVLNDLNKKSQEHQEEIDVIRNRLDSLFQQLLNLSKEMQNDENGDNINNVKYIKKYDKNSLDLSDLDLNKYTLKEDFDKHIKEYNEEIKKIWDEINKINELINKLTNMLNNKVDLEDLNELRDFILSKIDELFNEFSKKFADKDETNKSLKNLEDQIKKLYSLLKTKNEMHDAENWLLAKKPITGFSCAACESYIGDLRSDKFKFIPWNKLPVRDPGDKLYRLGNGFSRMLNMLNFDNNGNVNLVQNIESDSSDNQNENESIEKKDTGNINDSKQNMNRNNKTLLKNRFQNASSMNDNSLNTKMGHRTQNNFFKKEEIKSKYLPKLKKEMSADAFEKINEEKPRITKIMKKSYSKIHLKENN